MSTDSDRRIASLRQQRSALWQLLDDIDTLDDACRDDDAAFRERVRKVQKKRWDIYNPEHPNDWPPSD